MSELRVTPQCVFAATLSAAGWSCATLDVPQAGTYERCDVESSARAEAASEMGCPSAQLSLESTGPGRYVVRGCRAEATYCCYPRLLEVACEQTQRARACEDPALEPPDELPDLTVGGASPDEYRF